MRNLWFRSCFWIFGGSFKQLGCLVGDPKLRFYLVNYILLTDFLQMPSYTWLKEICEKSMEICDLAGVFQFLVDHAILPRKLHMSHRFLTDAFPSVVIPIHAQAKLWEMCNLACVFQLLVCFQDPKLQVYLGNHRFLSNTWTNQSVRNLWDLWGTAGHFFYTMFAYGGMVADSSGWLRHTCHMLICCCQLYNVQVVLFTCCGWFSLFFSQPGSVALAAVRLRAS